MHIYFVYHAKFTSRIMQYYFIYIMQHLLCISCNIHFIYHAHLYFINHATFTSYIYIMQYLLHIYNATFTSHIMQHLLRIYHAKFTSYIRQHSVYISCNIQFHMPCNLSMPCNMLSTLPHQTWILYHSIKT